MARPVIDAEEFDEIIQHCQRWAAKSLSIARALIVENEQLAQVAEQYDCSTAYANVIRARFYEKAERVRVANFIERRAPEADMQNALLPHRKAIRELVSKGVGESTIVSYLAEQDVVTTPEAVHKFIEGLEP